MISYVPELIKLIKGVTGNVVVTTTYPDTNIVPIVIAYESDQSEVFKCSEYEHVESTVMIEIYTKDIPTRNQLKTNIDKLMKDLKFQLTKKEDIDNNTIFVCKLTYECEIIERNEAIQIYNKKYI